MITLRHFSIYLLLSLLLAACTRGAVFHAPESPEWRPDILGDGLEQRTVSHPGWAISTIIRRAAPQDTAGKVRRALLYVHGFNDYFFQKELADSANAHLWDFYAVDLRRYGRSLREGDVRCQTRDLREYYADIDAAIAQIQADGDTAIALLGHSTGGLITSMYMAEKGLITPVKALALNSPFLDWNLGDKEKWIGTLSWVGSWWPSLRISQGMSKAYAQSLLKAPEGHGEWTFDTEWKSPVSPAVDAGWIRAINKGQQSLRYRSLNCPVMVMHSDKSVNGEVWTPEFQKADAVLDVDDIDRYGKGLSKWVNMNKIKDGLHDLLLSEPRVRKTAYFLLFNWLDWKIPYIDREAEMLAREKRNREYQAWRMEELKRDSIERERQNNPFPYMYAYLKALYHPDKVYGFKRICKNRIGAIVKKKDQYFFVAMDTVEKRVYYKQKVKPKNKKKTHFTTLDRPSTWYFISKYGWIEEAYDDVYGDYSDAVDLWMAGDRVNGEAIYDYEEFESGLYEHDDDDPMEEEE
ncbi:MAG: alpha/beta hydrolase [Bacteroidales bacterium]|nr:alpha/beta hydrolase [Bacteroidales bacterium]